VRRGRGLMPGGAGQLSSGGGVRDAAQVPSPRSRRGWPSAPRRRTWARSGRPGGVAGREDVRTPAGPVVACPLVRSAVGMSVRPVERTSSIQVSGVQASGASRCPDGQALVSAALPPRCPRRAGPRSGSVAGRPAGRSGSTCPGPRAGWAPARIGPDGKGMCGGCRCLLAGGSTVARAAAWPASRRRRRLGPGGPTRAGPGPGCRPGGGGAWDAEGASPVPPQGVGAVAGVVPDHGLGPRGGDHAEWSLGLGWSGGVQLRRAPPGSLGSSLRPQRGRGV
jgi:hypothetical protein